MKFLVASCLLLRQALAATPSFQPSGASFKYPVATFQGFSAHVVFSNLTAPRGITFDANQNLLVVERGFGVSALTQVNSPTAGWNRTIVIESPDFTQGFAFNPNGPMGIAKDLFVVDNAAELSDNFTEFSTAFAVSNPADESQHVQYTINSDGTITPPKFYGSPDCATIWNPQADPGNVTAFLGTHKGTQFSLNLNATRNDAWCSNTNNNVPPVTAFEVIIFGLLGDKNLDQLNTIARRTLHL
ncbi:hypothetical protein H0H93_014681 [Arthromyces matolae]|nr:hypothetical protein H0H93_014681 [Arthromyces matolae]